MMKSYSQSLTKNFKKQIENGLFSFLIVDNIHDKNAHYEEMWSFAKLKGYEVRSHLFSLLKLCDLFDP